MTCQDVEPLLAAVVDQGASAPDRQRVELHLQTCARCRQAVAAQRAVVQALAARGRAAAAVAPPGLATRISATLAAEQAAQLSPGWRFRLSAFAAAALVVLALGAVAVPVLTGRSTVVLAAQMALDHLKCFLIEPHDHGEAVTVAEAEDELRRDFGWDVVVPPTPGRPDARLIAARRCLYGEGRAAHLLYAVDNQPVSLFILSVEHAAAELSLLGQDEVVWTKDGRTYLLVGAAGLGPRLHEMASHLRDGAQ